MTAYIIRRILFMIPTLLGIMLVWWFAHRFVLLLALRARAQPLCR